MAVAVEGTEPDVTKGGHLATQRGVDLLTIPSLRAFLRSRWYPGVLQAIGWTIFAIILFFSFFGTIRAGQNLGTVLTWNLWWPLLPISLLLVGRLWCAVCPFYSATSVTQRLLGTLGRKPGRFLRRYGVWTMILSFLALTWADRMWNTMGSPLVTGIILAGLLLAALVVGLTYERATWCRYLCPLGAFTGLHA